MKALLLVLSAALAADAHARLGETEAQSATRYGAPDGSLIKSGDEPLIRGAKELAYKTGDWRIRAAFVAGVAIRIEYVKAKDAASGRKPTEQEVREILDAEKGKFVWHAEVMGPRGKRAVRTEAEATAWERSDRATARVQGAKILIESRDAAEVAEKLAKTPATAKPGQPTPGPKPRF